MPSLFTPTLPTMFAFCIYCPSMIISILSVTLTSIFFCTCASAFSGPIIIFYIPLTIFLCIVLTPLSIYSIALFCQLTTSAYLTS